MIPRSVINTSRSYCNTGARASFHCAIAFRISLTTRLPRHVLFQALSAPKNLRPAAPDSRRWIQSP